MFYSFHCICHLLVYKKVFYYFGYYVKLNYFLSFLLRLFYLDEEKMNFVCLFYILQLCWICLWAKTGCVNMSLYSCEYMYDFFMFLHMLSTNRNDASFLNCLPFLYIFLSESSVWDFQLNPSNKNKGSCHSPCLWPWC